LPGNQTERQMMFSTTTTEPPDGPNNPGNLIFFPSEMLRWKPPEQLLISQWIERNRVLSSDAEEKGPMRMRRTPYLIPILDSFLDPDIKTIVICKAAQIGLTEGMISVLGYFADQMPGPAMLVLADEDTANYMSINRIRPMFRNSPNLAHLLPDAKFHKSEIYLHNGASIFTGWASSVAKLASRPVQLMILDEFINSKYMLY